jgi:3-hexulose-6-phosphate synthase
VLLQVAIDRAEDFGVIGQMRGAADIIEIGTPLLKRFGIGAIATARELCPETPALADSLRLR